MTSSLHPAPPRTLPLRSTWYAAYLPATAPDVLAAMTQFFQAFARIQSWDALFQGMTTGCGASGRWGGALAEGGDQGACRDQLNPPPPALPQLL